MAVLKYRGLCAAVFNIFRNDLSVNVEVISQYAKFLAGKGVDGVLVNGTSGEGMTMNVAERKAVVEEWSKAVKATKQHLMVQVGGCSLPDALDLAKHAEEVSADSILCLPELYYKPSNSKQLLKYLRLVGDAAPKTPLLYYHIPAKSGVNINMAQLMNEAAQELPTFQGIKYTSSDLDGALAALNANNGNYAVFLGADAVIAPAAIMGFDSFITSTFNVLPENSSNIMKAVREGKLEEAKQLQNQLTTACDIISKHGPRGPTMKMALSFFAPFIDGTITRPPVVNLTEAQKNEMKNSLKSISLL